MMMVRMAISGRRISVWRAMRLCIIGKERAARIMESSADPRRVDPIVNPVPRSDNPYMAGWRGSRSVLRGAGKSLLRK